jgi:threonyl-tRNA synthetase
MASNEDEDNLYATRHSMAHIMAAAITRLWPKVKLGVGPVIENGFYYDIDLGGGNEAGVKEKSPEVNKISEDDLSKIEKEMQKIIAEDQPFEHFLN